VTPLETFLWFAAELWNPSDPRSMGGRVQFCLAIGVLAGVGCFWLVPQLPDHESPTGWRMRGAFFSIVLAVIGWLGVPV
jgi:hypothetical protein